MCLMELSPHDATSIAPGAPTVSPSGGLSSTLNSSAGEAVSPPAAEVAPAVLPFCVHHARLLEFPRWLRYETHSSRLRSVTPDALLVARTGLHRQWKGRNGLAMPFGP